MCTKKIKRIDPFSHSQLIICTDEKFGAVRKVLITQNKLIFFFRFYLLLYSIWPYYSPCNMLCSCLHRLCPYSLHIRIGNLPNTKHYDHRHAIATHAHTHTHHVPSRSFIEPVVYMYAWARPHSKHKIFAMCTLTYLSIVFGKVHTFLGVCLCVCVGWSLSTAVFTFSLQIATCTVHTHTHNMREL